MTRRKRDLKSACEGHLKHHYLGIDTPHTLSRDECRRPGCGSAIVGERRKERSRRRKGSAGNPLSACQNTHSSADIREIASRRLANASFVSPVCSPEDFGNALTSLKGAVGREVIVLWSSAATSTKLVLSTIQLHKPPARQSAYSIYNRCNSFVWRQQGLYLSPCVQRDEQ